MMKHAVPTPTSNGVFCSRGRGMRHVLERTNGTASGRNPQAHAGVARNAGAARAKTGV